MFIDDLPVGGFVGEIRGEEEEVREEDQLWLYTHFDFTIRYYIQLIVVRMGIGLLQCP